MGGFTTRKIRFAACIKHGDDCKRPHCFPGILQKWTGKSIYVNTTVLRTGGKQHSVFTMLKVITLTLTLLVTLLVTLPEIQGAVDKTLTPRAVGTDVVNSVLERIRSHCVFSEDRLFLRRTAYVMSNDGFDSNTYRAGFHGGLWQITESMFRATQNCHQLYLSAACGNISSGLGIQWSSVQWADLRKPLYSGLAAALSALRALGSGSMPGDIPGQAPLWARMYGQSSGYRFLTNAANIPSPVCEDKMDLAFVLDSSGSVSDFQLMKNFTAAMVDAMDVSLSSVRIADIIFAAAVNVAFDFDDYSSSKAAVKNHLLSAVKLNSGTNTAKALDQARVLFTSASRGARAQQKNVTVLVTDGRSDSFYYTKLAAQGLKDAGVTVFAVGVGNYNLRELQAVASDPVCSNVLTLTGFDKIQSIVTEIHQSTCREGCSGGLKVRLVNGSTAREGRLEVSLDGRTWGTVRDWGFSNRSAAVVCSMLGYNATNARCLGRAYFGPGKGQQLLNSVKCKGTESSLFECYQYTVTPLFDDHSSDVGVMCDPHLSSLRVRLVNGSTAKEGRLEVSVDGHTWGTVCINGFNNRSAAVVCSMLGYNTSNVQFRDKAYFGAGSSTQRILFGYVYCSGTEGSLLDCDHYCIGTHKSRCNHGRDVGVMCGVMVARLVNGSSAREGRLELSVDGQTWGTVCGDGFKTKSAAVACSMLGYNTPNSSFPAVFGPGSSGQSIMLDDVRCNGSERNLEACDHNPINVNDCSHTEDVGVVCSDPSMLKARLVNGSTAREGRLEVSVDGHTWGTVCDDFFDTRNAGVVCSMLGYNTANARYHGQAHYGAGNEQQPILLDDVRCLGTESSLFHCSFNPIYRHNCQHSEDVGISCN